VQGESREETGHGRCGKAAGGSLRRTRSRPESVRGSLRRKAAHTHPMTARGLWRSGGGDGRRRRTCVSTDAPMAHAPLGERKGVRSTPSLDDGVERQVAHSSTEAAWLHVASWPLSVGS
jgi:hypothetical protein